MESVLELEERCVDEEGVVLDREGKRVLGLASLKKERKRH